MGIIIDGKAIAAGLYDQMRQEVEQMEVQYGRRPGLTVIIVGEDPA
ncbi:MAG: bifunctional methylenetetrahydrofolate dehydrogenase/methenyltetrahydrofolate cyclohydrolase, partial [Bacteroidales bacterium]|nr:bifunctional methylenetetrahydrofolate dehydrogenase/methenyltetrahydrofolate cyclohydrolase [Bacteroidales bacterium]